MLKIVPRLSLPAMTTALSIPGRGLATACKKKDSHFLRMIGGVNPDGCGRAVLNQRERAGA